MLDPFARFNEGDDESLLKCHYQIRCELDNVKRQENTGKMYNFVLDSFISCLLLLHFQEIKTGPTGQIRWIRVGWMMSRVHTRKMTLNFSHLIHIWKKRQPTAKS